MIISITLLECWAPNLSGVKLAERFYCEEWHSNGPETSFAERQFNQFSVPRLEFSHQGEEWSEILFLASLESATAKQPLEAFKGFKRIYLFVQWEPRLHRVNNQFVNRPFDFCSNTFEITD